jgi:hypothetical protein
MTTPFSSSSACSALPVGTHVRRRLSRRARAPRPCAAPAGPASAERCTSRRARAALWQRRHTPRRMHAAAPARAGQRRTPRVGTHGAGGARGGRRTAAAARTGAGVRTVLMPMTSSRRDALTVSRRARLMGASPASALVHGCRVCSSSQSALICALRTRMIASLRFSASSSPVRPAAPSPTGPSRSGWGPCAGPGERRAREGEPLPADPRGAGEHLQPRLMK